MRAQTLAIKRRCFALSMHVLWICIARCVRVSSIACLEVFQSFSHLPDENADHIQTEPVRNEADTVLTRYSNEFTADRPKRA